MSVPTKRRREIKVGDDVVVFAPFVYERGGWRGSKYPIYRVFLNGAEVAWIEYERGVRAGHYLMTNGIGWTRMNVNRSWPSPTQVRSLSPLTVESFTAIAESIPEWAASGKVMTKSQQADAVIAWQAREDKEEAEKKARWAREASAKADASARAQRQAEIAAQERREQAEVLQGLLGRLQAASNLSNAEGAALADAIARAAA
ncbi:hypothetical protein [Caulobacter sp. FWC2]|uniref:hypothetical protein n=1 Tax=Caulobacter sp. FWC2 TaxID=69664 RepID=UPI000C1452D8|nr:hypothetical protein [Caulobacter sp. FWC2]